MMAEDREKQVDRDMVDTPEERPANEQRAERVEQRVDTNAADSMEERLEPLFEDEEADNFRTQWLNIQSKFVDNPRESVREADELVAGVLKSVTMGFHNRRTSLEKQWNGGNDVSTEDLRQALRRYRSFFDRLLTLES